MAYANGYLPLSVLAHAANGTVAQLLEAQTAKQWSAMVAAAKADGINLRPQVDGDVHSCYRDMAGQVRAAQIEAQGGPTAATPGHSSHGTGIAIDISMGTGVFTWLSNNAARFGFDNVQGKASGENWHWVRTRVIDVSTATLDSTPVTKKEDEDMKAFAIRNGDGSGSIGVVSPDGTLDGLTAEDYAALSRCGYLEGFEQETDGAVWGILTRRTTRLRAAKAGDPAAVAKATAALVIPAVLAALKSSGATVPTQQQMQDAAEAAIREVFADAAQAG